METIAIQKENRRRRFVEQRSFWPATIAAGLALCVSGVLAVGCVKRHSAANPPPPPVGPLRRPVAAKLVRSDFKEGELTKLCDAAITRLRLALDGLPTIASTPKQSPKNSLLLFEEALATFNDDVQPLTFMAYVSKDKGINKEGADCEQKVGQVSVSIWTRRDLYNAIEKSVASGRAEERLRSETLKGFEQNGLKLTDEQLAQVKDLKGQLTELESEFSNNLNSDTSSVAFTAAELDGAPESFLSRLEKDDQGRFIVTTKSTDYVTVMENVSVSETRRRMLSAYLNRAADSNTKLLEKAIGLRAQIAKRLGFETWADARLVSRMAKDKKTVLDFLNNLKGKLAQRNRDDLAQLLKYKREIQPTATALDQWDIPYLTYQLQKRDFSLDNETIREYFPADVVIKGMFEVYAKLLGVRYVEVKDAKVWADNVKLYEIHDASDDRLIAYFYADFVPRAGKYGHAAAFTLATGRRLANGAYSLPVSSIVANFTPPTKDKPSLLLHDEVETIFHEFGHIMHQTLTRAPFASLSGSSVAGDFVEAPSQMLENWVWSPEVLARLSGHYRDPQQKLPQDILQKMLAARDFGQGVRYTRQLLYALFDMTVHTKGGAVDVTQTYDDLFREIIGVEPIPGGHFAASFGHLMGGYDAGYYGYLWSEVYAQDMFSKFPGNDLTNAEVGGRYRRTILEQGGMQDAFDLLKEFLGRDPNSDAFFRKLGI